MALDPVEQTIQAGHTHPGSSGDSTGVNGFVQVMLAARQMRQRQAEHQDEVNLAQQRLNLENQQQQNRNQQANEEGLLAPLIRAHQAAVNKQTGATAQGAVLDTQLKADQMEGLNGLSALQLRAIRSAGGVLDPEILADTQTLYSQHSGLLRTQEGSAFLRSIRDAQIVVDFTRKFGAPTAGTVPDSESGAVLQFGYKTREHAQSEIGKMQADRQAALDAGDLDSVAEIDQRIDRINADKQYAPSAMGKKINEYHAALTSGDARTIGYYEKELGLAGLTDTNKGLYRAGLAAINADPTLYKASDKQAAQETFTSSFLAKHAQPASTATPPALPRSANPSPTTTTQTFTKGERRIQNGHTFEFDGSKWNRVP